MREQTSNLSGLLPGIVGNGLPSQSIVLETYPSNQLSELCNRPLEELFQFCTGIDSQRADAVVSLSFDQIRDAENFLLLSPSAGINDGHPSSSTWDYVEYTSAPQGKSLCSLEIDQQFDMYVGEPFDSQDGDLPVHEQLGPYEGESLYLNTSINSYPLNTSSDMSAPVSHRNFPVHPADMPQEMGWTGNDQDTRTVSPNDLLL